MTLGSGGPRRAGAAGLRQDGHGPADGLAGGGRACGVGLGDRTEPDRLAEGRGRASERRRAARPRRGAAGGQAADDGRGAARAAGRWATATTLFVSIAAGHLDRHLRGGAWARAPRSCAPCRTRPPMVGRGITGDLRQCACRRDADLALARGADGGRGPGGASWTANTRSTRSPPSPALARPMSFT